jgi:hypothetical protein
MTDFSNSREHPFTREAILKLSPGQIGVYGIYNRQYWVYIGRGDRPAIGRLLDKSTYLCKTVGLVWGRAISDADSFDSLRMWAEWKPINW